MNIARVYNQLIWFVVNTLIFWGMLSVAKKLDVSNVLISSIIISLGLVCGGIVVKKVKNKRGYNIQMNNILFWWFINFAIILIYNLSFKFLNNQIYFIILAGLFITIITYIIGQVNYHNRNKIVGYVFFLLLALFFVLNSISPVEETDYELMENKILQLVNEERARNNVRPLTLSYNLDELARKWSEKMIAEDFFKHSSYNVGENIMEVPIHSDVVGCGSTYTNEDMAECIVIGWIESAGHHQNMIDRSYSTTGIGIACDSSKCRATQMFS